MLLSDFLPNSLLRLYPSNSLVLLWSPILSMLRKWQKSWEYFSKRTLLSYFLLFYYLSFWLKVSSLSIYPTKWLSKMWAFVLLHVWCGPKNVQLKICYILTNQSKFCQLCCKTLKRFLEIRKSKKNYSEIAIIFRRRNLSLRLSLTRRKLWNRKSQLMPI